MDNPGKNNNLSGDWRKISTLLASCLSGRFFLLGIIAFVSLGLLFVGYLTITWLLPFVLIQILLIISIIVMIRRKILGLFLYLFFLISEFIFLVLAYFSKGFQDYLSILDTGGYWFSRSGITIFVILFILVEIVIFTYLWLERKEFTKSE